MSPSLEARSRATAGTGSRSGRTAAITTLAALAAAALLPLLKVGPLTMDNVVSLVAVPVLLGVLLLGRVPLFVGPLKWTALGLALVGFGSLLSALNAGEVFFVAPVRFLSFVLVLAAAPSWSVRDRVMVIRGALVVGLVLAASVYAQRAGLLPVGLSLDILDRESGSLRYGGLIGHPNFAAYYLGACILVVPLLFSGDWRLIASLQATLGGALLLTGSRNALLGLAVGLVVVSARRPKMLLLLVPMTAAGLFLVGDTLVRRFAFLGSSGGLSGQNASGWRLDHWRVAVQVANDSMPFGVGWNRYQEVALDSLAVHNGYLQLWVELGVLGVVGGAVLVLGLLRILTRAGTPGSVGVLAYLLLITTGDPGLLYPPIMLFVLCFACWHDGRRASASKPAEDEEKLATDGRLVAPVSAGRRVRTAA